MKRILWIGAIMTAVGTIGCAVLLALAVMVTGVAEIELPRWGDCPVPTGSRPIAIETKAWAWEEAKRLSGSPGVVNWGLPCMAVRYDNYFVGDPDGAGGLPVGQYLGLHHPPMEGVKHERGNVMICEYITIHLPVEAPASVEQEILTHEYLHAIFYRLWNISPAFRNTYPDPGVHNEYYVRLKLGDEDWLLKYAPEGKP